MFKSIEDWCMRLEPLVGSVGAPLPNKLLQCGDYLAEILFGGLRSIEDFVNVEGLPVWLYNCVDELGIGLYGVMDALHSVGCFLLERVCQLRGQV